MYGAGRVESAECMASSSAPATRLGDVVIREVQLATGLPALWVSLVGRWGEIASRPTGHRTTLLQDFMVGQCYALSLVKVSKSLQKLSNAMA